MPTLFAVKKLQLGKRIAFSQGTLSRVPNGYLWKGAGEIHFQNVGLTPEEAHAAIQALAKERGFYLEATE